MGAARKQHDSRAGQELMVSLARAALQVAMHRADAKPHLRQHLGGR